MTSTRDMVLMYGLVDWFGLEQVHRFVVEANPGAPLAEIQSKTLQLLEELVNDGLARLGEPTDADGVFAPWNISLEQALQRTRDNYVARYDDWKGWWFVPWVSLTDKGRCEAEAIKQRTNPPWAEYF